MSREMAVGDRDAFANTAYPDSQAGLVTNPSGSSVSSRADSRWPDWDEGEAGVSDGEWLESPPAAAAKLNRLETRPALASPVKSTSNSSFTESGPHDLEGEEATVMGSKGERTKRNSAWFWEPSAVKLERLGTSRGRNGFVLHTDGRNYSAYRHKEQKEGQPLAEYISTYRCSHHMKGCNVKIRVNGHDELIVRDLDKLSRHTCKRDIGRYWKMKIFTELRKGMDGAVEEGRVAKFNWEAVYAMHKFTEREQKLAKMSIHDARLYCYERARNSTAMTPIPGDRLDWDFDESSDKLFRRDPSQSFAGFGEQAGAGFKLFDQTFKYRDAKSEQTRLGKIVIFGDGKMLERWAPKFLGCVVDGSSFCARPPFAQLISLAFQLPLEWDAHGKVTKVANVVLLHVLMSHSGKEAYAVMWCWLKEFAPGLRLEYVMADSDVEACAGFLEVFGPVMHQRCSYHFGRTLRRHLVQKKVFGTLMRADFGVYRSWLRFLASLAYFKTQHVRPIYLHFREEVFKHQGQYRGLFTQHLLPCLEKLYIGIPLPDGRWTEPRLPFASFSRHQDVLLSCVQEGKAFESVHAVLSKAAGPLSGVYVLAECLYYTLEMSSARLRQLELIQGDARRIREDEELDTDVSEADFVHFMGGAHKPEADKPAAEKLSSTQNPFVRYVHNDTLSFVKKNPLARDFIKERVGKVESVTGQGYFPMEQAGRDLHLGFPSLDYALRCYAYYERQGEAHLYLWGRKVAQLVDHFGTPRPFEMSQREQKALLSKAFDPVPFHFPAPAEAAGPESDVEDALKEAQTEYNRRSESQDQLQRARPRFKLSKVQTRKISREKKTKVPVKGGKTRAYRKRICLSAKGGPDEPINQRETSLRSATSAKSKSLPEFEGSQAPEESSAAIITTFGTSSPEDLAEEAESGDSEACEGATKLPDDKEPVPFLAKQSGNEPNRSQWSGLDLELGQLRSRRAKVEEAAGTEKLDTELEHCAEPLGDGEAAENTFAFQDTPSKASGKYMEAESGQSDLQGLLDATDDESEDNNVPAFESTKGKSFKRSHYGSSDTAEASLQASFTSPKADRPEDEMVETKRRKAPPMASFTPLNSAELATDVSAPEAKRHKTEAKQTIPCPHCAEEVKAEELEAHLREDLNYYPVRCTLCRAHFLDWPKAEAHFGVRLLID